MSLDDGLSKFLGSLYEAVHDPKIWATAVAEIIRLSGSRRLILTTVDLRRQEIVDIQFHGPEDSASETGMREYAEEMSAHDPTFEWVARNPAAGLFDSFAVMPKEDHRDDPFIKWSASRFGTLHWRAFYSEPIDDLIFGVSFHAPPDEGPSGLSELPLQTLLFENLERSVRLAVRPPNFATDDSALIAIDATGRPLSLSQRAEDLILAGDGLEIRDRLLTAPDPDANRRLQHAVRAALDPSSGERPGRAVRINRGNSGKPDLLVIVSRFPPSLNHLPKAVPGALVRIIELEMRPNHLSEHSHVFDLSPRETQVAAALLEGHSVESLAASLGVARNTARNHLQSLFRKTGTNRQPDLMRLLDRIARQ